MWILCNYFDKIFRTESVQIWGKYFYFEVIYKFKIV